MVHMADPGTRAADVTGPVRTARGEGLSGCRTCGRVSPAAERVCPRCGHYKGKAVAGGEEA